MTSIIRHGGDARFARDLRLRLIAVLRLTVSGFVAALDGAVSRRAEEIAKGRPVQPFN
jgi:hypothetical protein